MNIPILKLLIYHAGIPFALLEGVDIKFKAGKFQLREFTIKAITLSSLGLKPYWRIESKEAILVLGYEYVKAPKKKVENYCYKFVDTGIVGPIDVVFFVNGENPPLTVYNVTEYNKLSFTEQYTLCPTVSLAVMVSTLHIAINLFGFINNINFTNIID